jgi:hypothetical protein
VAPEAIDSSIFQNNPENDVVTETVKCQEIEERSGTPITPQQEDDNT